MKHEVNAHPASDDGKFYWQCPDLSLWSTSYYDSPEEAIAAGEKSIEEGDENGR